MYFDTQRALQDTTEGQIVGAGPGECLVDLDALIRRPNYRETGKATQSVGSRHEVLLIFSELPKCMEQLGRINS